MVKKLILNNCFFCIIAVLGFFFVNLSVYKISILITTLAIENNIFLLYLYKEKIIFKNKVIYLFSIVIIYAIYFFLGIFSDKCLGLIVNQMDKDMDFYKIQVIISLIITAFKAIMVVLFALILVISIKFLLKGINLKPINKQVIIMLGIYGIFISADFVATILLMNYFKNKGYIDINFTNFSYYVSTVYGLLDLLLKSFFITFISVTALKQSSKNNSRK